MTMFRASHQGGLSTQLSRTKETSPAGYFSYITMVPYSSAQHPCSLSLPLSWKRKQWRTFHTDDSRSALLCNQIQP